MKLYLIVACCEGNGIGKDNALPWKIKEDLKMFKEATTGKVVVMGRSTFQSIGKPLPNRYNVVVTGDPHAYEPISRNHGNLEFCDMTTADEIIHNSQIVFVIGGSSIYRHFMENADGIYVTRVNKTYECDTFFPDIPESFRLSSFSEEAFSEHEQCTFRFEFYEKENMKPN